MRQAQSAIILFICTVKSLETLLPYFKAYRLKIGLGLLFIILANLFKTYNPVVVRNAIDNLQQTLASNDIVDPNIINKSILTFAALYLIVALIEGIFTFFMRQTIIVVSRNIEFDLKNKIYNHYQYLDQAFYRKNQTGDLMNRVTEDVSKVRMFIGPSIMYSVNLLMMFIFCAVNMFSVNWQLSLLVLIPLPFLSYTLFKLNKKINKTSEDLQSRLSDLTTMAQESFSGIRVIKSYVQESSMSRFFKKESEDYRNKSLYLAKVEAFYFPFIQFLIGLSLVSIIYFGGNMQIGNTISAGNIAEFLLYLNMLTFPMSALGWAVALTQQAAVSMRRINEFLEEKPSVINEKGAMDAIQGDISFDNVSFTYEDSGIEALKNINLTIKKGEKIAILGTTGSGKTTLLDLILRMYDTTGGSIKIDHKNIENINTSKLRESIAYVPQDVFLFSDTIESNILFSQRDKQKSAQELAHQAAIGKEIEQFEKGYETLVGERGVTLSGGQKQRISIARALGANPQILLMDDCLSAVDANTEKEIEENLREATKNTTVIIVTHRILSNFDFDQIVVLHQGEIKEIGKHDELMEKKGMYYNLNLLQRNDNKN